ncbi:MAG: hypothetical protein KY437_03225 [Actinobacteria bacterium]|nr:hypothetical protein [Actinomycetota bacterium]
MTATVWLGLAVVVALASLVTMVVVVATGDRDLVVAVIEVATWTAATIWLPVVAWRHYRRVTPRR